MKKHSSRCAWVLFLVPVALFGGQRAPRADVDSRVDALLAKMTIEEKVGQLVQFSGVNDRYRLLVRQGKIGSLLNVVGAGEANAVQQIAVKESRLGIPLILGFDVIHGFRTVFPIPLAEASSWDPGLAERDAAIAAREASAAGIRWVFAPMVDIARDARWGRIAEGSGEDTHLGSVMAAARVRGFQGKDLANPESVAACVKHYVAYGAAEAGRDYNTVDLSERSLREIYLPPFHAAVEAGVATLMSAFEDLDGIPATANSFTLTQILRNEWGFKGFVVSDWNSVGELIAHGVAADAAQAAKEALTAGVDMDMEGGMFLSSLVQLVRSGAVPESAVTEAARRVLRVKHELGLFDHPFVDAGREASAILSRENVEAARAAASKCIVLLKNDKGTLPLRKSVRSVAVLGPLADDRNAPLGPWAGAGRPEDVITVLAGIKTKLGPGVTVRYAKGCDVTGGTTEGFGEAVKAARESEVAILVVGEAADMSGEAASRLSLDLPGHQEEFVRRISDSGTPVVMVLMNGRPLSIAWAAAHVPSILESWFLGIQTGNAVADALFGDTNPGGKLPVTFPYSVGQEPIYYNHLNTGRPPSAADRFTSKYIDGPFEPLFPFGFGLSYTKFSYSDLRLSSKSMPQDGEIVISANVRNDGPVAGDEVVQLYIRDLVASVSQPVKELKGFRRITLAPEESRRVEFPLKAAQLRFYDREMHYVVEPGAFKAWVGPNSTEGLEGSFEVTAR